MTDLFVLLGPPHLLQGLLQEPPLVCKALAGPAALFQGLTQGVYLLLGREAEREAGIILRSAVSCREKVMWPSTNIWVEKYEQRGQFDTMSI